MVQIFAPESAQRVQWGYESTAGTAVAATVIGQIGFSMIADNSVRNRYTHGSGALYHKARNIDTSYLSRWEMPSSPLTFEQILFPLQTGIAAISSSGSGPYVWDGFDLPTGTTVNSIKTATIETYNALADDDYLEMKYAVCESMTFTCTAGGQWEMSGTWFGHNPTAGGSPTSLSSWLTVEDAVAMRTKLYIDNSGGTIGSTQKTGIFMGSTITVNTGWIPIPVGDGSLDFAGVKYAPDAAGATYELTIELEETDAVSTVAVERARRKADSFGLYRLEIDGTDANHQIVIDWAGKHSMDPWSYEVSDGNTSVTIGGIAEYSATDDILFEVDVTNNRETL